MMAGQIEVIGVAKKKKSKIIKVICDHHSFIGDFIEDKNGYVLIGVDKIFVSIVKNKIVAIQSGFPEP